VDATPVDSRNYFDNIRNMKTTEAVRALSALSQETRLDIFRLLVQQGTSGLAAGEIAEQLRVSPATLSFHLKELTHAKLITSRQDGRFIFYTANFAAMNRLLGFLSENCCAADGAACAPASAACTPSSSTTRPIQGKVKA
jgi:ArsR family transcriptional regulator